MWKYFIICVLIGITSCAGGNNADNYKVSQADDKEISAVNIQGQWDIENVVENDSSYVRPSEIEQRTAAYIDFRRDETFGIMTNCNHIGGQYHQSADSINLTDISTTEMACDNMDLEEILKKILPAVNTIDCINDSITRLNSTKADSYIVLKKRQTTVK